MKKIEIIFFYNVDNIKIKYAVMGIKDHRTYLFIGLSLNHFHQMYQQQQSSNLNNLYFFELNQRIRL